MRVLVLALASLLALPGCATWATWRWTRPMNVAHVEQVRAWRTDEVTYDVEAGWSEGTVERVRWVPSTQQVQPLADDAAPPTGPEVGPDEVGLDPGGRVLFRDETELFGLHRPEGCAGDVAFGFLAPFVVLLDVATFPVSIPLWIFLAGQESIRG